MEMTLERKEGTSEAGDTQHSNSDTDVLWRENAQKGCCSKSRHEAKEIAFRDALLGEHGTETV